MVLSHQGKPGHHTFLIQWKGYSAVEDTWELEQTLGNAQPHITAFKIGCPKDFPEYNHHYKTAKQWICSSSLLSSLSSPSWLSLAGFVMCSGTHSTQTLVSIWGSLGRDNPLSHLKNRTLLQIGRRCGGSPITALITMTLPQAYKVLHQASPPSFTMSSVLSIPSNEIPVHVFRFSIFQWEMLLSHILIHPWLSLALSQTTTFRDNPILTQLIPLFHNYTLVQLMFVHLTLPHLSTEISKAFDTTLSAACASILDINTIISNPVSSETVRRVLRKN